MRKFEIAVNEKLHQEITQVAEATNQSIDDIIQDILLLTFQREKANLVIQQYKKGNIKAREAWKLSGLSYQEFQDIANT